MGYGEPGRVERMVEGKAMVLCLVVAAVGVAPEWFVFVLRVN